MKVLFNARLCILILFAGSCAQKQTRTAQQDVVPPQFDTTIVVYDEARQPLHYSQYVRLIETGKYAFRMHNGQRIIERMPPETLKHLRVDSTVLSNLLFRWMAMADRIIINKAGRKLFLERNGKIFYECGVQLGSNPVGAKQKEGDGRTPEGLYYIDYNVNREPAYYRGFHISYPNESDKINAKKLGVDPGRDIMIHGTGPSREGLKDWTNGCIAISNSAIDTLSKYTTNGISIEIKR